MNTGRLVGGAVGLFLVAGAIGFAMGRAAPSGAVRTIGQTDVIESYALVNLANAELASGDRANAKGQAAEAAGYLFSAVTPLQDMGVSYASGLTTYLQGAEYDFVRGKASAHERTVLHVFHQEMAPLSHYRFGGIPDSTFRTALDRVESAISQ